MTFVLHLYEGGDENGTTVGSIDLTQAAISARFTDVLHGAGSMELILPRHHTDAAKLRRDRYGRLETDAGIVGGWFLEEGKIGLSSKDEKGGEFIKWEGRGSLAYLDRGVMDNDSNLAAIGGKDPIEGFWDLSAQGNFAGADSGHPIPMMKRALVEVMLNSPNGIPLVDHSGFDYALDSDGNVPPFSDGVFGVNVGDSLYSLAGRLDELGGFFQRMSDTFAYDMYLAYGTDKTGAFGVGTVRFEKGVNIAVELERRIVANVTRTHLVVGGANHSYLVVANPTYTPGDMVRWGFLSVAETDDPGQLEANALNNFLARSRAADAYVLPMPAHGNDPANGLYEPFVHLKCGDTVTAHTGTGPDDLNESSQVVAAITIRTKEGMDYTYDVELGSNYHWTDGPGDEFGPGGGGTTWLPHKRYDDFSRASLGFPGSGSDPHAITTSPQNSGMGNARSGRAWKVYDGNSDATVTMSGYKALFENGASLNEIVAYVEDPKGVWLSDDNDGGSTSTTEVMHFLFHARFEIFAIGAGTGEQVIKFFIGAVPQHRVTLTIDSSVGEIATDGGSTVVKNDWVVGSYDVLWEYSPDVYARVKVWPSNVPAPEAWTVLDTLSTATDPMEDDRFGFALAGPAGAKLRLDFIDIIHGEFAHGLATDAAGAGAPSECEHEHATQRFVATGGTPETFALAYEPLFGVRVHVQGVRADPDEVTVTGTSVGLDTIAADVVLCDYERACGVVAGAVMFPGADESHEWDGTAYDTNVIGNFTTTGPAYAVVRGVITAGFPILAVGTDAYPGSTYDTEGVYDSTIGGPTFPQAGDEYLFKLEFANDYWIAGTYNPYDGALAGSMTFDVHYPSGGGTPLSFPGTDLTLYTTYHVNLVATVNALVPTAIFVTLDNDLPAGVGLYVISADEVIGFAYDSGGAETAPLDPVPAGTYVFILNAENAHPGDWYIVISDFASGYDAGLTGSGTVEEHLP